MKDEYDFSKGERGKFLYGETILVLPIDLNHETLTCPSNGAVAIHLLKKDSELITVSVAKHDDKPPYPC
jgi:hypothetical protein